MYKIKLDTTQRNKNGQNAHSVQLLKIEQGQETPIQTVSGNIDVNQTIYGMLKAHSLAIEDVEFDAAPGPGSFTGIKIGVTIANLLNTLTGKKTQAELIEPHYGKEPNISDRKKA